MVVEIFHTGKLTEGVIPNSFSYPSWSMPTRCATTAILSTSLTAPTTWYLPVLTKARAVFLPRPEEVPVTTTSFLSPNLARASRSALTPPMDGSCAGAARGRGAVAPRRLSQVRAGGASRCLCNTARILTLKLENCLNAVVAAAAARSSLRQRAMVSAAAFSGHPRRTRGDGKALICNFGLAVRH